MINFQISNKKLDVVVVPVFLKNKKINFFNNYKNSDLLNEIKKFNFKGEKLETLFLNSKNQKYFLIGFDEKFLNSDLRNFYSFCFNFLKEKYEKISFEVPNNNIQEIIEGISLSDYKFDKYKIDKKNKKYNVNLNVKNNSENKNILKQINILCENIKTSRDLIFENSNIITPVFLEKQAKIFSKKNKLKIEILNEKQIFSKKLNLLNAVGMGSSNPPRLIIMEYCGDKKNKKKICLVGKGITFDTGGSNLKLSGYMEDMRGDMAGSSVVFGTFKSIVENKLKKNVICVMTCAENSISHNSYKCGDTFVSYNGLSVEIGNTDAEGRLVLADAISYVSKKYKPNIIIDVATLTGAIMVSLGLSTFGIFSNDEKLAKKIFESGEKTDERVWQFPIYEEHKNLIKSQIADIKNTGGRFGGSITAAAFLEKFIEKNIKWCHIDIAGSLNYEDKFFNPKFGNAKGVRLLYNFIENY